MSTLLSRGYKTGYNILSNYTHDELLGGVMGDFVWNMLNVHIDFYATYFELLVKDKKTIKVKKFKF